MNFRRAAGCIVLLAAFLVVAAPVLVLADDSAPSIAAGGLVPRHETRVVLAKETVSISDQKVSVDYDFRNDTGSAVTTDLIFPVPPYNNGWDAMDPAIQSFRSLLLWVDGKPINYQTEAKAMLKGEDVSRTLRKYHIDIASFGHLAIGRDQHFLDPRIAVSDFAQLRPEDRLQLQREGILTSEGYCLYTVNLRYHWTQTFPARSTVHIRQVFKPALGFTRTPLQPGTLQTVLKTSGSKGGQPAASPEGPVKLLESFCPETAFLNSMIDAQKQYADSFGAIHPHWVDFGLTSAAAWHKPIADFTLIVEIPAHARGEQTLISFCSPGKIERPDANHIQVHLTNFVPMSDLHIGFFNEPEETPDARSAMR